MVSLQTPGDGSGVALSADAKGVLAAALAAEELSASLHPWHPALQC